MTALRLVSSALLGAAAACVSPDVDAAQIMRFCAIAIAGVLTIGLMTDTLRAVFETAGAGRVQFRRGVRGPNPRRIDRGTGAPSDVRKCPALPRKRSCRLRSAIVAEALSTRRVLRHPEAPWGLAATDPAVERLMSLMKAGNATHVIILSHQPVDLLALAVPVISADPATETALALVRRISH